MALKLYIRQLPIYNVNGQQIHYAGNSPQTLTTVVGALPPARQFASYPDFIDVTDTVSDLHALKLTWTIDKNSSGVSVPGESQIKKSASGSLSFELESYQLLKQWLVDDVSASLNAVEAKIEDTSCGYYEGYIIKSQDLSWCEGDICQYTVTLKQKDEALNCIKRTLIADNWQGWFQKAPANGKMHPRFAYCVEQRPNGNMIMLWWIMATVVGTIVLPTLISIALALNPIIFVVNAIIAFINLLGANINPLNYFNPFIVLNSLEEYFVESAGCGREHPAVLIRDYISNVCNKCGVLVDEVSAPIFFASQITIQTSDPGRGNNGTITTYNPHYNACYFNAPVKRGIRRFKSLNIFGASPMNTTEFWIPDNQPLLTLDMFLDQIKGMYNAEWRVRNNTLYFWRKDWFLNGVPLYDFTTPTDWAKILEGVCYEPNELKYPAYCKGIYQTDASDMNEAGGANGAGQMNGIVSFGNIDDNPNYEGVLDKTQGFGATKFNLDGASTCYYLDAFQQLANASVLNPVLIAIVGTVSNAFRDYADYALLMQGETCSLPKIVIWRGDSYLNARAEFSKAAYPGVSPYAIPDGNPVYNNGQNWFDRHSPETFVTGSSLTLGSQPTGVYEVSTLAGTTIVSQPALLLNYPMYFEPFYRDTLWDWFHWIDDPKNNPKMNFNWRVKIGLCCEELQKIGVLNDASDIALGQNIIVPYGYYGNGKLLEVTVDYDTDAEYGQTIELKGEL